MHTHVYACIHVWFCLCMCMRVYLYVYECIYAYVHLCVCLCICVNVCICGFIDVCVSFFRCYPFWALKRGLSLTKSLLIHSGWLVNKHQKSPCLWLPSTGIAGCTPLWLAVITWVLETELRSSYVWIVNEGGFLHGESLRAAQPSSFSSMQMEQWWWTPDSASPGTIVENTCSDL